MLANGSFRGRDLLDAVVTLPLVLPPTVLGYYLLILLGRDAWLGRMYEQITGSPLVFTWHGAVVAALLHSAPLLVKTARAALEWVDHSYERAARSSGRFGVAIILESHTCRLAWRSILAGAALCFARSLGDFGATLMVAGNIPGRTQTVAIAIYDAVESGNGHVARVLVLVVSAIALLTLTLANRLGGGWLRGAVAGPMIQASIGKQISRSTGIRCIFAGRLVRSRRGVTVLFGPSGAGKTLVLDCIAGFVRPDSGRDPRSMMCCCSMAKRA